MGGLLSFLGGSAFRMIWGEASAWLTAKQEHKHEIDRLSAQERIDAAAHARNLEAMRLQADLGIKTIVEQRDADLARIDVDAWADMSRATAKKTGIYFIDAWNGAIRPLLATLAILFIVAEIIAVGFVLSDYSKELFAAILGLYIADRSLGKRGK